MADSQHIEIRTCTKCGRSWPWTSAHFAVANWKKAGLLNRCRECTREGARQRKALQRQRAGQREKDREYNRIRRLNPAARAKDKMKRQTVEARSRAAELCKRPEFRAKQNAYLRKKRTDPVWRERVNAARRKPERRAKFLEWQRGYKVNRMKRDPDYRLRVHTFNALRRSLCKDAPQNAAVRWWEVALGYTARQLRAHLEDRFSQNMNWENRGSVWEVDHIVPVSSFFAPTKECAAYREAWALSNLRPLLRPLNRAKGAKLE